MKSEEALELFFVFVTGLGGAVMIEAARHPQVNYDQIKVALILIGIGLPTSLLIEYRKRKRIPKKVRPKLKVMKLKWWEYRDYQYDLPWWFSLLQGIFVESIFTFVVDYFLLLVPIYIIATFVVFRFARAQFQLTLSATIFLFYTCLLSTPFVVAAIKQPDFLAPIFSIYEISSRRATALLLLYTQVSLVLSSAMLVAYSWRLGLLRKNKLDGRAFRRLTNEVIQEKHESEEFNIIEGICLDVPLVVQSFSQGNYALCVSFGWSIIYRGLDLLSDEQKPIEQAKAAQVYSEAFRRSKRARNHFVHRRHTPTLVDSLNTLKVIRDILEAIRLPRAYAK